VYLCGRASCDRELSGWSQDRPRKSRLRLGGLPIEIVLSSAEDGGAKLRRWLGEREQHPAARRGEPALWLGRPGRLSPRRLQRVVTQLAAAAGLEVSAHKLRHTAATRWLRTGVDVVVVAGLLGHSSLDTTRTYTRPTDRELATAVEAGAVDY
jgi:site-specific recombinase XerD